MDREIGQCGNCGGSVVVPTVWLGVIPPVPTCTRCGATAKPKGPVIEMNPPDKGKPQTGTSQTRTYGGEYGEVHV